MDQNINLGENIDNLFHSLENFTQKEGIIGKSVTQGDKTFIPVLSVSVGYGHGNSAGKGQQTNTAPGTSTGGALGLGAKLCTDAVIVIDNNNQVSMLSMSSAGNIVDKIPQMVASMSQTKAQQQQ